MKLLGGLLITAVLLFATPTNSFAASKKPAPKPKTQDFLVVDLYSQNFIAVTYTEKDSEGRDIPISRKCFNRNEYSDLVEGVQVVIENEKSIVIASDTMKFEVGYNSLENKHNCNLKSFMVKIPISKFYKITVGSKNTLTYSHKKMISKDWRVVLNW